MKKLVSLAVLVAMVMVMTGCCMHTHVIGDGAQRGVMEQQRQWYVLWGLVPINDVDTEVMAAGEVDYTIKTEQSALDVIINIFTGWVTVYSRTVTVTK